jgi:diaminopimelate decarboxylase
MTYSRREFLRNSAVTMAVASMIDPAAGAHAQAAGVDTADFSKFIDPSGDELQIGGRPLSWWVETFDLPLNVSYAPDIRANVRAFKQVFRDLYPNGEVRYAGKADTHPLVFRLIGEESEGIDVASPLEAKAALQAGISPHKLDVNGNSKSDELIKTSIENDMLIVIDGIEELERTATLAKEMQKTPRAILRISGYELGTVTASAIFTAGIWTKFGIDLKKIPALLPRLADLPVKVIGFHTHIGSQITDVNAYLAVLGKLLELGALLKQAGHDFTMVNIGGGYPVSYVTEAEWQATITRIRDGYIAARKGDTSKIYLWDDKVGDFPLDADGMPGPEWEGELFWAKYPKEKMLEAILRGTLTVNGQEMKTLDALEAAGTPTLVIEPGRAIVSDAGATFLRIAFLKTIAEYHNMIAAEMGVVFYGEALIALPVRKVALATAPNQRDREPFETFIAGNLCFNADMLCRVKVPLQRKPDRGDIIIIPNTGAYNPTFFAANANSFPRPARILVDEDGSWAYTKTRDTYDEIFSIT